MITNLPITSLFVLDQDEALRFYVDVLGLEKADDLDFGPMRWLTVRVPGTDRQILLEKPGAPMHDAATAQAVADLVTKGASAGTLFFSCDDARATHADLAAKGVELPEEPTEQPYGLDFGFRDPFGNNIRINQPATP